MIKTYFSGLHPGVIFLYYGALAVMSMMVMNPIFLGTITVFLLLYLRRYGNNFSDKRALPFCCLFAFIVLLNMMTNPRGRMILFYVLDRPITLEGMIWGITMALAISSLILVFIAGKINFNSTDFLYIFAPVLPKVALLLSMSTAFVSIFQKRISKITVLLKGKGIDTSCGSLKKRCTDAMSILVTLITFSLEEAMTTADSMKARGYGVCKRKSYRYHKIRKKDGIYIGVILFLWMLLLILFFSPSGVGNLKYMVLIFYLLLPYMEEWRFAFKWKYLEHKG